MPETERERRAPLFLGISRKPDNTGISRSCAQRTFAMPKKSNVHLRAARNAKKDEFYTQLSDIEKELLHYLDHFRGKVVLCNCDDPRVSKFFHYFSHNFEHLRLKNLIATCYKNQEIDLFSKNKSERAVYLEYAGDKNGNHLPDREEIDIGHLKGDGDFRSAECINLLKQADIVVTNPPFSLFREYVAQLIQYDKKFVIIGNKNAITYKEIFKLIKNDKLWLGYRNINNDIWFQLPDDSEKWEKIENGKKLQHIGACWFTNLDTSKRHEKLILYKTYTRLKYPRYDNYDAINVDKVADIPCDYDGVMGVPITFLDKYNPGQFEIVGSDFEVEDGLHNDLKIKGWHGKFDRGYINGTRLYSRLLIRNRQR